MKVSRHAKIIELISQYDIETQEELAEYLNNAGFKVTQATVSRDIRDLKLTKISVSGGRQKYVIHRQEEPEMNEKNTSGCCATAMSQWTRRRISLSLRRYPEWQWQSRLRWTL